MITSRHCAASLEPGFAHGCRRPRSKRSGWPRRITLAPTRMLVRPGLLEPPDGRGREPAGILDEAVAISAHRNQRWRCPSGRESGSAPLGSSIGANRRQHRRRNSDVLSAFCRRGHARAGTAPRLQRCRSRSRARADARGAQVAGGHHRSTCRYGLLSQAATSASTACPNSVFRAIGVKPRYSGSENCSGWVSSKNVSLGHAYPPSDGEVEALNTPTIRRLTPSCRHQLRH